MIISHVMTTSVVSFRATTTIAQAAEQLYENHISGAPVVNEQNEIIGMISEKDIFRAVYPTISEFYEHESITEFLNTENIHEKAREIAVQPVCMIMKQNVIFCHATDSIIRVGALMLAKAIHRLPVIEEGKMIGIVDREDIFHEILRKEFFSKHQKHRRDQKKVRITQSIA